MGRDCSGDSITRFCWRQALYARIKRKIINHNTAAGMFMGTAALAGGIFNAACMTW
ncbi:Hypothetical protein c5269 [Escherichia coli CFT073]|uniref:Uncharacterized protein n=1 Tax=Escherichia coli O6:H1 (strain CFT073 / ATCC 700928 / UPEC) TaxID=199310 RepID=A0A0H2VDX3_ECOL6|nr:Hypothetical protein c5269 [Escherichia coli CFT073]